MPKKRGGEVGRGWGRLYLAPKLELELDALSADPPPPPLILSTLPPISLAKVQLPDVGVNEPSWRSWSSAVWKSPKSPKLSNDESSSENEELNVNVSWTVPPLESEEKGPKPSYEEGKDFFLKKGSGEKVRPPNSHRRVNWTDLETWQEKLNPWGQTHPEQQRENCTLYLSLQEV